VLIGVTGGIGAGKSAAVDAFVRRGAVAFSADEAVHRLYRDDPDVRAAVRDRWGDAVFDAESGDVDRGVIADIVFANPVEREWLEGLLHPLVAREWLRVVHELTQRDDGAPELLVAEVPLLFEANLQSRYDVTVLVTAPLETRLKRVGDRAHGARHADARAAVQLDEQHKERLADFCFHNTDDLDALDSFVDDVIAAARERIA
jgi:dephospho-CoA kinase